MIKERVMNRLLLVSTGVLLATCAPAWAQDMGDPFGDATVTKAEALAKAGQMFEMIDADHNATISPQEIEAVGPMGQMLKRFTAADGSISKDAFLAQRATRFDQSDADHDGQLTKAERDAARMARMQMMQDGHTDGAMPMPPMGK